MELIIYNLLDEISLCDSFASCHGHNLDKLVFLIFVNSCYLVCFCQLYLQILRRQCCHVENPPIATLKRSNVSAAGLTNNSSLFWGVWYVLHQRGLLKHLLPRWTDRFFSVYFEFNQTENKEAKSKAASSTCFCQTSLNDDESHQELETKLESVPSDLLARLFPDIQDCTEEKVDGITISVMLDIPWYIHTWYLSRTLRTPCV